MGIRNRKSPIYNFSMFRNEDTDTIDNNNEEQILSDGELDNINNSNNNNNNSSSNFDSVFSRIEHLLNGDKKNCGRSRSEGWLTPEQCVWDPSLFS